MKFRMYAILAIVLTSACGIASAGTAYMDAVGAPPDPRSTAFKTWLDDLIAYRDAEVPTAARRTMRVYFDATEGSDTFGNGTKTNPYKTLAKAQAIIDSWTPNAGGLGLFFDRSEIYRSTTGLDLDKSNISIDVYGIGAPPIFSAFTHQLDGWTWNDDETNDTYQIDLTEAGLTPQWVRRLNDVDANNVLSLVTSAANCAATTNSWYWDNAGKILHVNLGGQPADPDTATYAVEACQAINDDGVKLSADGTRVDNIRSDGFGVDRTTAGQYYGFKVSTNDTDAAVVKNCQAYYWGRHGVGKYTGVGAGGIATFINCSADLGVYNSNGSTVFVAYTAQGGDETILKSCSTTHGIVPVVGTITYPNSPWLTAHSSNNTNYKLALLVMQDCTINASKYQVAPRTTVSNPPVATELPDVRVFRIGHTVQNPNDVPIATTNGNIADVQPSRANMVTANSSFGLMPGSVSNASMMATSTASSGWLWNSTIVIDMNNPNYSTWTSGRWGIVNENTQASDMKWWNNHFHWIGDGAVDLGLSVPTLATNTTAGAGADAVFKNNVFTGENLGTGSLALALVADDGWTNEVDAQVAANGFWSGLTDGDEEQRYSTDPLLVAIATADIPDVDEAPESGGDLDAAGALGGPKYDANWKPRPYRPAIGPLEPLRDITLQTRAARRVAPSAQQLILSGAFTDGEDGGVWYPDLSSSTNGEVVVQTEIIGTLTIAIEGRVNRWSPWVSLATANSSAVNSVTAMPEMRARISAYTAGWGSAWLYNLSSQD